MSNSALQPHKPDSAGQQKIACGEQEIACDFQINWVNISTVLMLTWSTFHNDFSFVIKIRREIVFSVTPLKEIISLQNFAHAMTAQLSCHVQNFIVITWLQLGWEQNEISIGFELWWKNRSRNELQYQAFRFHISLWKVTILQIVQSGVYCATSHQLIQNSNIKSWHNNSVLALGLSLQGLYQWFSARKA